MLIADGERRGGDRRDGGESAEQHEDKARRERSSPKPPKKLEEKTPVSDWFIHYVTQIILIWMQRAHASRVVNFDSKTIVRSANLIQKVNGNMNFAMHIRCVLSSHCHQKATQVPEQKGPQI